MSGATSVTFRNYVEPPLLKSWIRPWTEYEFCWTELYSVGQNNILSTEFVMLQTAPHSYWRKIPEYPCITTAQRSVIGNLLTCPKPGSNIDSHGRGRGQRIASGNALDHVETFCFERYMYMNSFKHRVEWSIYQAATSICGK